MDKIVVVLFLLSSLSVAAYPEGKPPEGEGWNYLSKVQKSTEGVGITLMPEFDRSDEILHALSLNQPELSIELLYTMPLPDTGGMEMFTFLLSRLQRISSMEGTEYYSHRRGRMHLFLEDCYIVGSSGSKKRLEDPDYSPPESEWLDILFQRDTTFGNNWYSLRISRTAEAIRLRMENIEPMRYLFFKVMPPGGLVIEIVIVPRGGNLLFYALVQLERSVSSVMGQKVSLSGAFDHRASAYQGWFARAIYPDPLPGKILSQ